MTSQRGEEALARVRVAVVVPGVPEPPPPPWTTPVGCVPVGGGGGGGGGGVGSSGPRVAPGRRGPVGAGIGCGPTGATGGGGGAAEAGYVDCVVTSPPYFRLRNYQHDQQLGLEQRVDDWVANLRLVLSDVARVLTPTGTVWLNLGDSYSTGKEGAPRKSLLLGPERLALALINDGWVIRNKVIWAKRNPMPSAVPDRLTCSWEIVYLLTRSANYFFDLDAVRLPHKSSKKSSATRGWSVPPSWRVTPTSNSGLSALATEGRVGHALGKNPGDVWRMSTASYRGAHHAVFPVALAERPILAGSPQKRCVRCHQPWERGRYRQVGHLAVLGELRPTCACGAPPEPGVVLDPFIGSGTTAIAAERHGRNWIGIELNPDFAQLADERIRAERTTQRERRAA